MITLFLYVDVLHTIVKNLKTDQHKYC